MSNLNINRQAKDEGVNLIYLSEESHLCTGLFTDYGVPSAFSLREGFDILNSKESSHYIFATDNKNKIIVSYMEGVDSEIPTSIEETIAFLKQFIIGKTLENADPERKFGLIVSHNGLTKEQLALQVRIASEYHKLSRKFDKSTDQVLDLLQMLNLSDDQAVVISDLITYIKDRDLAYNTLSNKLLKIASRKAHKGEKFKAYN